MNMKKIGLLLKNLREEKDLTQEDLANKLSLTRQAISRWEVGKSLPDQEQLMTLSKLYNISINEILAGEKYNKYNKNIINNKILDIINEVNLIKKVRNYLIIIIIILLSIFSIYYMFTYFNQIKIYEAKGSTDLDIYINNQKDTLYCHDALLVITNDEVYFKTCDITSMYNLTREDIDYVEYFYIENGNEHLISGSGPSNTLLYDRKWYKEYFDYSKLDIILKNLYVRVFIDNNSYTIKLEATKTYSSNRFFYEKY